MSTQQQDRDWGQIGLIALVVLALVASVIMLLTDSIGALKLALLAALWAAIIGVFLGARYRNQAQAAQREMELAKRNVPSSSASTIDDSQVLQDIRQQLQEVRTQLEELSQRGFEFEPGLLRAEARRVMELEAQAYKAEKLFDTTEMAVVEPELPSDYTGMPSADAVSGNIGNPPTRPISNPLSDLINEREQAEQEPSVDETPAEEPAPEPEEDHIGRRRAGQHNAGVTVAELLARAKREK